MKFQIVFPPVLCNEHERVNVLFMSHDHGGGSQDYVGMGKSFSCSITDARERE